MLGGHPAPVQAEWDSLRSPSSMPRCRLSMRLRQREHDAKIRACVFQIECNAAAHELALRLDKQAVADWKAAIAK